ncbi:MAG: glycosyltransferase family 2 protein [Proteobacteria bacterium]|nr:glycosyltransferase family 2 protein [Pseudomonadota bacterium]
MRKFSLSHICVVIPLYKARDRIADVLRGLPEFVRTIVVVDDCSPDDSYACAQAVGDKRVHFVRHKQNQGVGGAVLSGYRKAIELGAEIIVKMDSDGQMDPALIPDLVGPILTGEADYTKGNRFYDLEKIHAMPPVRLFGNALLSLMAKLSSGYWDLFDPTNGYTAIHVEVAKHLPFTKISRRYFFETDMLFRLNTLRAVVIDVPMDAKYGAEVSNLKISKIVVGFFFKHILNFSKRIFYNYYLRDMSLASIELPLGILSFIFGCGFGVYHWIDSLQKGVATTSGRVMLAALPILMGMQLILAFLGYDIANVPRRPWHKLRRILKNSPTYIGGSDEK